MTVETLVAAVRRSISADRLSAYEKVIDATTITGFRADMNPINVIARYLWNEALCESLYPALQTFEVCLRNAIYESLAEYYTPEWLTTTSFLRSFERDRIRKAEDDLLHQGMSVTPGKLVAELTLGFWTGLFVHEYDRTVALPVIGRRLRGFPSRIRTRRDLYARFDGVRQLRNRVFHYEPILNRQDLLQRHKDLIDDIGFISPEMRNLILLQDRFLSIYDQGWQHWKSQIETEIINQEKS